MTQIGVAANGQTSLKPVPTRANLTVLAAVWNAFWWREIDFYPRIATEGEIATMETSAVIAEIYSATEHWAQVDGTTIDEAIKLARQSLDEVKEQTEYQDQKATRLLTVTTFLTALSGLLFTRFQDNYPLGALSTLSLEGYLLALASYAFFGAFVMAALSGALVTFHATRTRFKYPPFETASKQEEDPKSLVFYSALVRVRPRAWANAWVATGVAGVDHLTPALRADLFQRYFQNLVGETYLVAAKTADKLRYLQPAQSLLAISLRCLLVWLILLAVLSVAIPPTKPAAAPREINLVAPSESASGEPRGVQSPATLTRPPPKASTGGQLESVPPKK
jgi:hypothetical protein